MSLETKPKLLRTSACSWAGLLNHM